MQQATTIPYGRVSLFFVFILAVLTWGFYKTYLIFFPSFTGFTNVQHFHGAMMMTWMTMLIIQPLLIRSGKINIHRIIGKLSYIIAPIVIVSLFLVTRSSYLRPEPISHEEKIGFIALPLPALFAFAALYILAIVNRRNTYNHMRYMIGTGLLMIGPGLGRALIVYYNYSLPDAVDFHNYIILGIAAAMMFNDMIRKRSYMASATALGILVCMHLWWSFRMSATWQTMGEYIAENFF